MAFKKRKPIDSANMIDFLCMHIAELETFLAVTKTGTYRHAADHMSMTQAAVMPLFINFQLGPEYEQFVRSVVSPASSQHFFMGNSSLGIQYMRRRKGIALHEVFR